MTTKKAVGLKVLTKRDLERLANQIYNPKTGKYLRLCCGVMKNGPDTITGRTSHCGLGELELLMTGKEPRRGVTEDRVIYRAGRLAKNELKASAGPGEDLVKLRFAAALEGVMGENDGVWGDAEGDYRSRARAVAKQLRAAAALLVGK